MNLGRKPKLVKAVVGLITSALLASLAWVASVGDGHEVAEKVREPYAIVTICPSAARWYPKFKRSEESYREVGLPAPLVREGKCKSLPLHEEAHVRGDVDQISGYEAPVTGYAVDQIVHYSDGNLRNAIAYILPPSVDVPSCAAAHVLGHLTGLGHTTAATSVMASPCGKEYTKLIKERP